MDFREMRLDALSREELEQIAAKSITEPEPEPQQIDDLLAKTKGMRYTDWEGVLKMREEQLEDAVFKLKVLRAMRMKMLARYVEMETEREQEIIMCKVYAEVARRRLAAKQKRTSVKTRKE